MKRRLGARVLTYASAGFLLLWTVIVAVLISLGPEPGEADPQALGVAFLEVARAGDIDAAKHLIDGDPGDDRIAGLLSDARCAHSVQADDLVLKIFSSEGTECGRLPIIENDGRWFVDPWADPLGRRMADPQGR